jgi:hypothetical protein
VLFALAIVSLAPTNCGKSEPQIILPGKLDLAVVAGDELKLCPADGVEDTTPAADCVIGPASNALAPYAKALKSKGWIEETGGGVWMSPAGEARRRCLVVSGFRTNFTKRERTLLEFQVSDPGLPCPG